MVVAARAAGPPDFEEGRLGRRGRLGRLRDRKRLRLPPPWPRSSAAPARAMDRWRGPPARPARRSPRVSDGITVASLVPSTCCVSCGGGGAFGHVVPGSGTGDLAGLHGDAVFAHDDAGARLHAHLPALGLVVELRAARADVVGDAALEELDQLLGPVAVARDVAGGAARPRRDARRRRELRGCERRVRPRLARDRASDRRPRRAGPRYPAAAPPMPAYTLTVRRRGATERRRFGALPEALDALEAAADALAAGERRITERALARELRPGRAGRRARGDRRARRPARRRRPAAATARPRPSPAAGGASSIDRRAGRDRLRRAGARPRPLAV